MSATDKIDGDRPRNQHVWILVIVAAMLGVMAAGVGGSLTMEAWIVH